ncbi:MAG: glycosyltransferase [Clostridiales bacterium]|nr:glycosyltransferase [Clostridiales bacterium]
MSEKPMVSLIVPVYGVQAYLDRCVQSIVDQTYTNLEILLVDDGSPDACPQMCEEWAKRDSRICVIHKENGGLSDARNAGLSACTGEYIGFIDSDDWIEPMFVQNLLGAIEHNDCDAAGCAYRRCTQGLAYESVPEQHTARVLDRQTAMSELIDNRLIQQVVWNKLYKRTLIDGILFEKEKYHEDEFWSYQVLGRVSRYAVIDYIGYDYFQRTDSIMGEAYSLKRLDAVEAKARRQAYLEENMPELAEKGRINLLFTCMWHGQMAMRSMNKSQEKQAIEILERIMREYPIMADEIKKMKASWRIWYILARISLPLVCRVRNVLRIGL